jgi:BirA family biotin operon repressor/biotin-[acetyl-CoA-carboxylase] ligase
MRKRTFADIPILEFDEIDSTNKYCLDNLKDLIDAFPYTSKWLKTVVIANHQTMGKGRRDREWLSHPNSSMLASFIVYPKYYGTMLDTGLMMCLVNEILNEHGVPSKIKWPNDIMGTSDVGKNTKKLSGVLTQIVDDHLVIGIGINITSGSSGNIEDSDCLETYGFSVTNIELLDMIIKKIVDFDSSNISSGDILKMYRNHSATLGKTVRVEAMNEVYEGKVIDFADNGALILEIPSGREIELNEGDVIHLR